MAQYSVGTVTLTANSATVTGSGTTWIGPVPATPEIRPGDYFYVPGVQGRWQVKTVASNTSLTLTTVYDGSVTGASRQYAIVRDFTPRNYPLMRKGDVETAQIFSDAVTKIDADIGTSFADRSVVLSLETYAASTTYPMLLRLPAAAVITRVTARTRTGNAAINILVNTGTATGLSGLAISPVGQTITATAAAPINASISLQTTAGTPAAGLVVQVDYRHT